MSLMFKRGLTTVPKIKAVPNIAKSPNIICIGRNYA